MAEVVKGIVIHGYNTKEKDKNVLLFTIEKGKIWVTLKGVRGDKAKMKYAKEPFCFGEFTLEDGKAGKIVTAVDVVETFSDFSKSPEKFFEANALLEVVCATEFENLNESYNVFLRLLKSLKELCFHEPPFGLVLCKFLIDLFKVLGVGLYSPNCTACGSKLIDAIYVNYIVGELSCAFCKNFQCEKISKVVFSILKILDGAEIDTLHNMKFKQDDILTLVRILKDNFYARYDKKVNFIGILP